MREPHYCPTPQPHMSSPGKGKAWGVAGAGGISSGVQAPGGRELQGGASGIPFRKTRQHQVPGHIHSHTTSISPRRPVDRWG